MARIDRRVSPNQLSLWTVAELMTGRSKPSVGPTITAWTARHGRLARIAVVGRVLAAATVRVVRRVIGRSRGRQEPDGLSMTTASDAVSRAPYWAILSP